MKIDGVCLGLRMLGMAVLLVAASVGFPASGLAETWTDATGSFSIDAKFIGVSGKDVVLQKADGKTINVPIARLSDASRAQAKRLYELSKAAPTGGAPAPAMPADGNMARYQPKPRQLNFTPPTPPTIRPLRPYPENASLQQAWEHVRDEAMAGNLEVLWQAMPEDIQAFADSQALREGVRPYAEERVNISPEVIDFTNRLTELLITKKQFILDSPLLNDAPPEIRPLVMQVYDPIVGIIHEYAEMSFNGDAIFNHKMSDFLGYHLPRLGGHLQLALQYVPPVLKDMFLAQITVNQTSETSGTITLPGDSGNQETYELVRYNNRWLPKKMVESWLAEKDVIVEKIVKNAASGIPVGDSPESIAAVQHAVEQANKILDPLLAATTQQEFDAPIYQLMLLIKLLNRGVDPNGPPGPLGLPPLPQ